MGKQGKTIKTEQNAETKTEGKHAVKLFLVCRGVKECGDE